MFFNSARLSSISPVLEACVSDLFDLQQALWVLVSGTAGGCRRLMVRDGNDVALRPVVRERGRRREVRKKREAPSPARWTLRHRERERWEKTHNTVHWAVNAELQLHLHSRKHMPQTSQPENIPPSNSPSHATYTKASQLYRYNYVLNDKSLIY